MCCSMLLRMDAIGMLKPLPGLRLIEDISTFLNGLARRSSPGLPVDALVAAVDAQHVGLCKWLHEEKGIPCTKEVLLTAVRAGNLELFKWARGHGAEWDARTSKMINMDGHSEMLQWAVDNG